MQEEEDYTGFMIFQTSCCLEGRSVTLVTSKHLWEEVVGENPVLKIFFFWRYVVWGVVKLL